MDYITTAEAAAELSVTAERVRQFITEGRLKATKAGRDWLIDPADLKAVRERKTGRPPKPSI